MSDAHAATANDRMLTSADTDEAIAPPEKSARDREDWNRRVAARLQKSVLRARAAYRR